MRTRGSGCKVRAAYPLTAAIALMVPAFVAPAEPAVTPATVAMRSVAPAASGAATFASTAATSPASTRATASVSTRATASASIQTFSPARALSSGSPAAKAPAQEPAGLPAPTSPSGTSRASGSGARNGSADDDDPARRPVLGPLVLSVPFENRSENRSLYWMGEALADGIARGLRLSGGMPAERRDLVSIREEMGIPPLSTMTLASQIRTAERLGASTLVTGAFDASDDTITVQARIVDIASGRIGPWITITGSSKGLIRLQQDLFNAIRPSLPRPPAGAAAQGGSAEEDGVPQAAYESLLRSFIEDAPEKREKLLRHSLELAPSYLRAKIELAEIYQESNQLQLAAQVLSSLATRDRALAAEGENLLAEIEIEQEHASAAEAALRRSLAMKETSRAHLLMAKLALARGDRALAGTELARARELDPGDPDLDEVEEALSGAH
jgi:TolB-like protein